MVYPAGENYGVLIDYAHNGASFKALFSALRERNPNHIIAVFGAGGDRPPMRRRDLARAAARGADYAVVTEDNPRSEPVEQICAQISAAMPDLPHAVILDRREAIRYALDIAEPGDIVALLGKGHEEYQIIGTEKTHFSDQEQVADYFGKIS
jgi:UDP-N-acetylmuramoyl-L-alanyl-D-glutamate--2,6-diaminopimelate ligase